MRGKGGRFSPDCCELEGFFLPDCELKGGRGVWSSHLIAVRPPDCCELRGGVVGGGGGSG